MSSIKERINKLKQINHIQKDSDLLRGIYQYLYKYGNSKSINETEDSFVRKNKGSFSAMIDGKRAFDQNYYYPLEKILNTSIVYILDGTGEPMEKSDWQGIHYAASSDTVGNYEKVIEEGVYTEEDEYQCTLLDYMVELKSKNGLEFFAKRNQLPLNEIGQEDFHSDVLRFSQHSSEELLETMLEVCDREIVMKYLDGYYFVRNGKNPETNDLQTMVKYDRTASNVLAAEGDYATLLFDCKEFSLAQANPGLCLTPRKKAEKTIFVNHFLNLILRNSYRTLNADKERARALWNKAIEINDIAMPKIMALGYPVERIGDLGYVYGKDDMVLGSIALVPDLPGNFMELAFEKEDTGIYEKALTQLNRFKEKSMAGSVVSQVDGEMRLTKQDNPGFYDFYRLMEKKDYGKVARFLGETKDGKDRLDLPVGQKETLPSAGESKLLKQALTIISEIDALSEETVGKGKVYAFPGLDGRSFYVFDGIVTGIAPITVKVGGRYDNLADLLAGTCLATPVFYAAERNVASVCGALKTYGIAKKDLSAVLTAMAEHYLSKADAVDLEEERGKQIVALFHQRALWLELFGKEVAKQY